MRLTGHSALVTGGGSGVGAVIARKLAEAGAVVTICGRNAETLAAVAASGPGITAQVCDITDENATQALFARGPFDIVVANAGISDSAPLTRTTLAQFRAMIDTNLTGTFLTLREALRGMEGRDWGRVIAIASTASLKGYAYVAPYAAAKHGVLGLVRSAALEQARKGITVNAICPGFLDTEMTERSIDKIVAKTGRSRDEARASLAATNPMQRLVPPDEVAEAVLWLCGPGSSMVTGQAISISGGETC
ncbi:SDR family NAD(P)-dependent oxidoreductase [Paracoccus aestuariivivens]|uniref:SDR family oxidoreductase n=1 Tax=Paracoccus aestuariivivens TaxID=1820333 RepID=A0A6L6JIK6_9RHOB|nr:SDR family NAD(P)-dependent oxidoreductase [Paracoccus aestuariivivens]MTH79974.1 SDR family oxidoreductase [Paracoccus aestuariivivens]